MRATRFWRQADSTNLCAIFYIPSGAAGSGPLPPPTGATACLGRLRPPARGPQRNRMRKNRTLQPYGDSERAEDRLADEGRREDVCAASERQLTPGRDSNVLRRLL